MFPIVDGQKIAIRLSRQINKESKRIRTLLVKWYMAVGIDKPDLSLVLDTNSTFWIDSSEVQSSSAITFQQKQEVIINYFVMKKSKEEEGMLIEDINNSIR